MTLFRSPVFRRVLMAIVASLAGSGAFAQKRIVILTAAHAGPRIDYGAGKLADELKHAGYVVTRSSAARANTPVVTIRISVPGDKVPAAKAPVPPAHKEAFAIRTDAGGNAVIAGSDASGALYGCMELAEKIRQGGKLPLSFSTSQQPEMVLRGTCIGLQKPALLPGRAVYEYPYTPENFPWFYDKALWIRVLDMLAENRMNSLYLWNGHPFASLVKLSDYPYAVEVDEATFKKNEEIFRFLTTEADKRGIWVIQMFYNIIVSKPFAERNHMKTQDRNRPIVPLIADYTRKSVAAFIEKYPNVGLMCALGEAMEGVGQDDVDWFTKTIIPGVQDGLKALGRTDEPPIILRAHDTDAPRVMKAALPLYKNLYTEAKFNGEALTTYEPRGPWAELHRSLSRIGTVQIENVHILANLEPFRYGSADFIQKSVRSMHTIMEANGLHLYPQASYWDWPYTADKTEPRLLQIDRDWIWYKEWSRYAWNSRRDRSQEITYWSRQLADRYGMTPSAARSVLEAYEESGQIAPKLLRRYGITDGNRQTLTLGMLMTQLIDPEKFGLFPLLYNSEAPEGEMIIEYAEKAWNRVPHIGETPVKVASEVILHGKNAVLAIDRAAPAVAKNKAEFGRLRNDMYCYRALADFYAEKVQAALLILRYKYSNEVADLEKAVPILTRSVESFKRLAALTNSSYLYANSMQTSQRKIPMRGVDGTFKTWAEMVPVYQKELANLKKNIATLKAGPAPGGQATAYTPVDVTLSGAATRFHMSEGASLYSDTAIAVNAVAPQLAGLTGVRLTKASQLANGTEFTFTSAKPVKVLVGFFAKKDASFLAPPELETDATANEYGQDEIRIANALSLGGLPPVNVHSWSFPAGTHTLKLGKGMALVLGFIEAGQAAAMVNAGLGGGQGKDIDWLFEK